MAETSGVVVIGWLQLVLATGFIVAAGALALALGLGLTRDLAIATLRTYLQLLALGLALRWIFGVESAPLVLALIVVMTVVATRIIVKRAPDAPRGIFASSAASMAVTAFAVTFAVTALVIRVEPWYRPQYVIPIAGMVIGNSMNGVALALERMFADLDSRAEEIRALLALGATPWEAAQPSVRMALRAGIIPSINTMAAVGIVFIPGMMAGQILAGTDPLVAAPYQIVVMLMVGSADIFASIAAVMLTYHRRFTAEGVYLERGFRADAQ